MHKSDSHALHLFTNCYCLQLPLRELNWLICYAQKCKLVVCGNFFSQLSLSTTTQLSSELEVSNPISDGSKRWLWLSW